MSGPNGRPAYNQRVTGLQVVQAYREHGNIWKAAKALGICGQSVWERMRAMGHRMQNEKWTEEENNELASLLKTCTLSEIANRLGRSYAGVAIKVSRLHLRTEPVKRRPQKIQRGVGLDKASVKKHLQAMSDEDSSVTKYCRKQKFSVDNFALACQTHFPEKWDEYAKKHGKLPTKPCAYCEREFHPQNGRQKTCSRKCQARRRTNETYFGGKHRQTIGLAEGVCQLCKREGVKGLSSHHVLGKQNDPDNDYLVALCRGCHQVVGTLAGRNFIDDPEGWESLISLCLIRRHADKPNPEIAGVHACVDIEWLSEEDLFNYNQ